MRFGKLRAKNAAYLAAICDLKLRFRATTGGRGAILGTCVAKTLRFCVCVWKTTKPMPSSCGHHLANVLIIDSVCGDVATLPIAAGQGFVGVSRGNRIRGNRTERF